MREGRGKNRSPFGSNWGTRMDGCGRKGGVRLSVRVGLGPGAREPDDPARTFMNASFFSAVRGRRAMYAKPVPTLHKRGNAARSIDSPVNATSREVCGQRWVRCRSWRAPSERPRGGISGRWCSRREESDDDQSGGPAKSQLSIQPFSLHCQWGGAYLDFALAIVDVGRDHDRVCTREGDERSAWLRARRSLARLSAGSAV